MNKNTLFKDNGKYLVKTYKSKEEWRKARKNGIGGSDVAAILGLSPFKDKYELYKEKTGEDINKSTPAMEYGTECEEYIRKIFKMDHKEYQVFYKKNITFKDKENDFISYSPDGILYDKENKKWGILEIKTTTIHQKQNWEAWNNSKIPDYYYAQILQGMLVTGAEFVVLTAYINIRDYLQKDNETKVVREYIIERKDCINDIKLLRQKEIEFWNENIMKKIEPSKSFKL